MHVPQSLSFRTSMMTCTLTGTGTLSANPAQTRAGICGHASRPRLGARHQPCALGRGKGETQQQQLQPSKPGFALPLANAPIMIKVPMLLLAAAAALQVGKLVVRRVTGGGSMSDLEERGFVSDDRKMGNGAMQGGLGAAAAGAGQVKIEELSDEQIAAARKRRMEERESWRVNIDEIDLPENHPFAVKKPVSKEEEELMRQRLKVRRGLPLQDLSGKRGFPDEGPPKGSGGPLDPAVEVAAAQAAQPGSKPAPEAEAPRRQFSANNGGSRSKDLFGTLPPRNENVQKQISQELEGEGKITQPSETGTQAGREKLRQLMEAAA